MQSRMCLVSAATIVACACAQINVKPKPVEPIAGCYYLGDSTGKSLGNFFPSPARLDTAVVALDTSLGYPVAIAYAIKATAAPDSAIARGRTHWAVLTRLLYWYPAGTDSIVLFSHDGFSSHEFRLKTDGNPLKGQHKSTSDGIDLRNPPRWRGATAERIRCPG